LTESGNLSDGADNSTGSGGRASLRVERSWEAFLRQLGKDPKGEFGLVARNFLLQEGIPAARVESYRSVAVGHGSGSAWVGQHETYLINEVYCKQSGESLKRRLDPKDPMYCPESFRHLPPDSPFLTSQAGLTLVRVESLSAMVDLAKEEDADTVRSWAQAVLENSAAPEARDLNKFLEEWGREAEIRPTFAGFWEEVQDLLPADRKTAPKDWADRLRDRLGLAHFDPRERGGPIDILVFAYPVGQLTRLQGQGEDRWPLVPPTVLDSTFSAAFFPAPEGALTGHVLHLGGTATDLRREVLHPTFPYQAKHLVRVGTIREAVNLETLSEARGLQILLTREEAGRLDYAADTDADLLKGEAQ